MWFCLLCKFNWKELQTAERKWFQQICVGKFSFLIKFPKISIYILWNHPFWELLDIKLQAIHSEFIWDLLHFDRRHLLEALNEQIENVVSKIFYAISWLFSEWRDDFEENWATYFGI